MPREAAAAALKFKRSTSTKKGPQSHEATPGMSGSVSLNTFTSQSQSPAAASEKEDDPTNHRKELNNFNFM